MLNFSSISLANAKVRFTFFFLAYALALILYWPSFSGLPVWDDMSYWFYDPIMSPQFDYSTIWLNYTWPVSVAAQKFLLNIIKNHWWAYHAVNFSIHALNAWMVYYLLRLLRLRQTWAFSGFLFFLIHPASVISVAWMIQFKTLICFTFALVSLILFVRARSKWDLVISVFFFLMSVLAKSSSLPLPIALLFLLGRSWKTKKGLTLIPFLLVSLYGVYRIANSEVARTGIKSAAKVATEKVVPIEKKMEVPVQVPEENLLPGASAEPEIFKPLPDEPVKIAGMDTLTEEMKLQTPEGPDHFDRIVAHGRLLIKTLYYYFWQAYLPVDNAPVKGLNPYPPGFSEYVHLSLLVILLYLTWKTGYLMLLLSAHAFILPYLGIVPAPYMNVTWVSDQHLYLALPIFVALLFSLVQRWKWKWSFIPVSALLIFFAFKTRETSHFYKNNFTFYEASIHSNFNNVPLVYNLSVLYILQNREQEAANLLETLIQISGNEPYIRKNQYFPYIIHVYSQLKPRVKR